MLDTCGFITYTTDPRYVASIYDIPIIYIYIYVSSPSIPRRRMTGVYM